MPVSNRSAFFMVVGSVIGLALAVVLGWSAWPLNRHDYIIVGVIVVGALATRLIPSATNRKAAS